MNVSGDEGLAPYPNALLVTFTEKSAQYGHDLNSESLWKVYFLGRRLHILRGSAK